ncbi:uncharacterized protein METZ01_LOCUS15417, partial [marine metagenome]
VSPIRKANAYAGDIVSYFGNYAGH